MTSNMICIATFLCNNLIRLQFSKYLKHYVLKNFSNHLLLTSWRFPQGQGKELWKRWFFNFFLTIGPDALITSFTLSATHTLISQQFRFSRLNSQWAQLVSNLEDVRDCLPQNIPMGNLYMHASVPRTTFKEYEPNMWIASIWVICIVKRIYVALP